MQGKMKFVQGAMRPFKAASRQHSYETHLFNGGEAHPRLAASKLCHPALLIFNL